MLQTRKTVLSLLLAGSMLTIAACGEDVAKTVPAGEGGNTGNSAPTTYTIKANKKVLENLPFDDGRDFEEAQRGLIAKMDDLVVKSASDGETIWDMPAYDFLNKTDATEAPSTVNPSLWRQAQLNAMAGLYKVKDGIYQLRNTDLATWSIIKGKTGWILVDPGLARENSEKGIAFIRKHLIGDDPITAVLITHSHIDHFGGILAVTSREDQAAGKVKIYAPAGFMEEATSENVLLGNAMTRRAGYQYGRVLTPGHYGAVDLGLGKTVPFGTPAILKPDVTIQQDGEEHVIDGVRFIFDIASGTEAPAEFMFYLPEHNAFNGAEVLSRTMHNIYTLRGAKVRDALLWSKEIDAVLQKYGHSDVIFNSHHWPIWGKERITEYLEVQRDTYKFIHDQTVRMAVAGMTPTEIANEIELPKALRNSFYNQGYYGTVEHNAKAVYQFYLGWFDGNPANLHPIAKSEASPRYVDLMGGAEKVITAGQEAYDKGEYQWAAELLNHVVFTDEDNAAAKELLAKCYDQMAWQAESGPWRSEYLVAAHELRHGVTIAPTSLENFIDLLKLTPTEEFIKSFTVRVNAEKAEDKDLTLNITFTDSDENFVLRLKNSVLHYYEREPVSDANVSLQISRELFLRIITKTVDAKEIVVSDNLTIDGSTLDLLSFFASLDNPDPRFPIVTP